MGRGKRHSATIAAIVPLSTCPDRTRPALPLAEPEDAGDVGAETNVMVIPTVVESDDGSNWAQFDALPWFEQASDRELYDLVQISYGGNYAADEVAEWSKDTVPVVMTVIAYSRQPRGEYIGFECHVSPEEAERWLRQYKPDILAEETAPCDRCETLVLAGDGHPWPDDVNPTERLCVSCFANAF